MCLRGLLFLADPDRAGPSILLVKHAGTKQCITGGFDTKVAWHSNSRERRWLLQSESTITVSRNERHYGDGLLWTDCDGAEGMRVRSP